MNNYTTTNSPNTTSNHPSQTTYSRTKQLTLIGLMTAVICVLGPLSIPLPFSPVPLSLTNFVIFITIYILGMKNGTFSLIIYLLLGAIGLPVFSAFSGGLGKLAGPTGGYLIGFLFLAVIQGYAMYRFPKNTFAAVTGMILGMAVCYTFGTIWLAYQMELTFGAALAMGVLPYLVGDGIKIALAAFIGPKLVQAIQKVK